MKNQNIAKRGPARFGPVSKSPEACADTGGSWRRQAALVGSILQTLPLTQPPCPLCKILDLCLRGCRTLQRLQTAISSALRDTRGLFCPSWITTFLMTFLVPLNPVNLLEACTSPRLALLTNSCTHRVRYPEVCFEYLSHIHLTSDNLAVEASPLHVPYTSSPHSWGSFHEQSPHTVLLFCFCPSRGFFLSSFPQILSSYQTLCWSHLCPVLSSHSSPHSHSSHPCHRHPNPNHQGHDFPMMLY